MPMVLQGHKGKVGLLALLCLGMLLAVADSERTLKDIFDQRLHGQLQASQLASLDDLSLDFDTQRFEFLPIMPPDPEFGLNQPRGIMAIAPKAFPLPFLDGLVPENDDEIPVYPVTVCEDPVSRDRIVLNAKSEEIARVAAPPDYDPAEYVKATYPQAVWNPAEYARLTALYDPARIAITYRLIDEKDIGRYAAKVSLEQEEARKAQKDKGGGIIAMKAYEGPPVTDIRFTWIEQSNGCTVLTIAYPWQSGAPTNSYTNRLELFGCTNLVDFWWSTLGATNVSSTTNWVEWIDSDTNRMFRFYAAGNGDLDSDSDQLTDAREHYLYHSSPTNSDTDGDTLSDYEETVNRNTDPCNSDTGMPIAVISYPTNSFTWVWMP